jgi:hypothetical protein
MNDKPRDEIQYTVRGQFTTPGVAFPSYIIFTAQTSCISEQIEYFSSCPNGATIQHGYQRLAVEKAHATDVIG